MPRTERKGPYFIEYNEDLIVIRCNYPFEVERMTNIHSVQQGKDHATRPFVLHRGDVLTLKGEGLPDEVIENGGYPGGAA